MRKVIHLFFLILFCLGVGKAWHFAKDGFHILRIGLLEECPVATALDQEILAALDQPFRYLARGHQCYAFASEDDRYVIKMPRTDIYRVPFWRRVFPFDIGQASLHTDKEKRKECLLRSFRIAFEELREETGLMAVHLKRTGCYPQTLNLIDRIGRRYSFCLDDAPFLLQKKRPILMQAVKQALKQGDREEAKRILAAFIEVVDARAKKAILFKDASYMRNYGYDGKTAYMIDIGSFYRREDISLAEASLKSFSETLSPLKEWLADNDPELFRQFEQMATR